MLWKLDPAWLMMGVATVAVLSYYFGTALNAVMRGDGFGPFGNAIIVSISFFVAILFANEHGYNLRELHLAVLEGELGRLDRVRERVAAWRAGPGPIDARAPLLEAAYLGGATAPVPAARVGALLAVTTKPRAGSSTCGCSSNGRSPVQSCSPVQPGTGSRGGRPSRRSGTRPAIQ